MIGAPTVMADLIPLESVRGGLLLAFFVMLPAVAAGLAAAVVLGGLAGRLGLRDPQLVGILRAIAVILTLALLGDMITQPILEYCRGLWGQPLIEAGGG